MLEDRKKRLAMSLKKYTKCKVYADRKTRKRAHLDTTDDDSDNSSGDDGAVRTTAAQRGNMAVVAKKVQEVKTNVKLWKQLNKAFQKAKLNQDKAE